MKKGLNDVWVIKFVIIS